jgi:hypothetical protein
MISVVASHCARLKPEFATDGAGSMIFRQLFDSVSGTYTYLIASRRAARR